MFIGVTYNLFTTAEVREAMARKAVAVAAKVAERRLRVQAIVAEYEIAPEALADLVLRYVRDQQDRRQVASYSNSARLSASPSGSPSGDKLVPAGVVANIVEEKTLMEGETKEVEKLNRVLRNLRALVPFWDDKAGQLAFRDVVHKLTDDEIDYLELSTVAPSA